MVKANHYRGDTRGRWQAHCIHREVWSDDYEHKPFTQDRNRVIAWVEELAKRLKVECPKVRFSKRMQKAVGLYYLGKLVLDYYGNSASTIAHEFAHYLHDYRFTPGSYKGGTPERLGLHGAIFNKCNRKCQLALRRIVQRESDKEAELT